MTNVERNKKLIKKYPFIQLRKDYFDGTWLTSMPIGWEKNFGISFCEDILNKLNEIGYPINEFKINDIKEKWGQFECYFSGPDEIQDIVDKYTNISREICINCGKPATCVNTGWISYFCEKCAKEQGINYKIK